jgi:hypothetical protein
VERYRDPICRITCIGYLKDAAAGTLSALFKQIGTKASDCFLLVLVLEFRVFICRPTKETMERIAAPALGQAGNLVMRLSEAEHLRR